MKIASTKIFLITFLFLMVSCNFFNSAEYREVQPGLKMKLHEIGSSGKKIQNNDYLTVHFCYKTMSDSVFYEGRAKFRFSESDPSMIIAPAIKNLQEGDSITLIVRTREYFLITLKSEVPSFLNVEENMKIDMRIYGVQTEEEFTKEKELFLNWLKEFYQSESQKIAAFLENNNLQAEPSESGLYFIRLIEGNGEEVKTGKRVTIHYQGRFLNGYFIDDTYERNEPLEFVYGTDFYIIEGLEEAVGRMREGEKALVIVPSSLAFGSLGSAGGVVPPYTSLIYEVEVIKVE